MSVHLMFYEGYMGAGKTSKMSLDALIYQQKSGCTLFSNYGLKGSIPFSSFSDFKKVAMEPSSIICLDESHMDLNNRDFNSNSVKYFVNMVWFLRKMRCTLMMTSPLFDNIDSKVRQVTDVLIDCHSNKNGAFIYDYYDVQKERYKYSKYLSEWKLQSLMGDIYDTYAMVTPLEYPTKKEDYLVLFEELKVLNQKYIDSVRNPSILVS